MRVITVINQKGGVGKSTTAATLLSGFTLGGKRALAVDLDAQGNLSFATGAVPSENHSLALITGKCKAADAIQNTDSGYVIPSSKDLAAADAILKGTGREYRLREALDEIRSEWDFILIDTPPALGILTVNALTAADTAVIPAQADIFSVHGVEDLAETIGAVKKYTNPALTVAGILLTRYNSRSVLSREITELAATVAEKLQTKVFQTTIREGVAVKEAQVSQKSLFSYAPKAKVTGDYAEFIEEFTSGR